MGGVVSLGDVGAIFAPAFREGEPCVNVDGYEDIAEGAQVVVKDQSSVILGTGHLSKGSLVEGPPDSCDYSFSVGVADSATHYTLEVAEEPPVTY